MENPIKMDDLGGFPPIFGKKHMVLVYKWNIKSIPVTAKGLKTLWIE